MTPMIDVIFNLLIFFVCTVSFQEAERGLPANLSSPGNVGSSQPVDPLLAELEEAVVKLRVREGRVAWEINRRPCGTLLEVRRLLEALAAAALDVPVILDADGDVPLGDVIDLYDICRIVGFQKIQFAAKSP